MIRRVAAATVGGALAVTLAACGSHASVGQPTSPAPATSTVAVDPTPNAQLTDVAPDLPPVAPATTAAAAAAAAAAAQQSADLAAIVQDLNGIDSGTNQANNDLNAGDDARDQNDNG